MLRKSLLFDYLLQWGMLFLPVRKNVSGKNEVGICCLLCKRDLTFFIYTIQSFFYFSQKVFPLFIINDGSLKEKDMQTIHHFFMATIIDRPTADRLMRKKCRQYPFLSSFRFDPKINNFKLKLDLLFLHPFSKFILIDADILFFEKPTEIIKWLTHRTSQLIYTAHKEIFYLGGTSAEFSMRRALYKLLKFRMTAGFSSGLLCFPSRQEKNIKILENGIKIVDQCAWIHHGGQEEFFISLLFPPQKSLCLDKDKYAVFSLNEEYLSSQQNNKKVVMKHFGWDTKRYYSRNALKLTHITHFFKNNPV